MKRFVLPIFLLLAACKPDAVVSSPDGNITLAFSLSEQGRPSYSVDIDGLAFINESALGLEAEGFDLLEGFELKKIKKASRDIAWTQPWGENKDLRDIHNEMAVLLKSSAGDDLTLRFRVFDDGFAWRYECSLPACDTIFLNGEKSCFNFENSSFNICINHFLQ